METDKTRRMTSQRRVILEELMESKGHPTADELYERVKQRLPRISLGTVYRNLELLAAQGQIRKVELSGRQMRFDAGTEAHYHIRCIECGAIEDIAADLPWAEMIGNPKDFRICGIRLEFLGHCPECDSKKK